MKWCTHPVVSCESNMTAISFISSTMKTKMVLPFPQVSCLSMASPCTVSTLSNQYVVSEPDPHTGRVWFRDKPVCCVIFSFMSSDLFPHTRSLSAVLHLCFLTLAVCPLCHIFVSSHSQSVRCVTSLFPHTRSLSAVLHLCFLTLAVCPLCYIFVSSHSQSVRCVTSLFPHTRSLSAVLHLCFLTLAVCLLCYIFVSSHSQSVRCVTSLFPHTRSLSAVLHL